MEIKSSLHWGIQQTPSNLNPSLYTTGEYGVPHFLCEDINVDYAEEDLKGRFQEFITNKIKFRCFEHVDLPTVFDQPSDKSKRFFVISTCLFLF